MAIFLAGVANADVFALDQLISSAKTLIDSSITVGVTAEDIRAGQGAKLYGKFFHSGKLDMKLTDQMFNIDYIAQNLGSTITVGGDGISEEEITLTSGGAGTLLVGTPVAFGSYGTIGWASLRGSATPVWTKVTFTGQSFTVSGGASAEVWCVRYFTTDSAAKKVTVSSNILPKVVTVILTANLYNGNPSDLSSAQKIGKLTIKVPALQLDGNQELSMTMTGASQTALTGTALAIESGCVGDGYFAEIIQSKFSTNWYDDAIGLYVDDNEFTLSSGVPTRTLVVYAIYPGDVAPKLVPNSALTFTSLTTDAATVASTGIVTRVAAGTTTITITVTAKPAVEGTAFVTVS
jgi:hypothetical protein